jgi:hypothetical protein
MNIIDCGCHGCSTCLTQDRLLESSRAERVASVIYQDETSRWHEDFPVPCFAMGCTAMAKMVLPDGDCRCWAHSTVAQRAAFDDERTEERFNRGVPPEDVIEAAEWTHGWQREGAR